jgi:hypothetical protein
MNMPKNISQLKERFRAKKSKSLLVLGLGVVLVLLGGAGLVAQAQTSYAPPTVNISDVSLDSGHTSLTFTASGLSGHETAICNVRATDGSTALRPYKTRPYVMNGGTATASSINQVIASSEVIKTSDGVVGQCQDNNSDGVVSESGEYGEGLEGSYTLTKSFDVSSLANGDHTLSVTLCAVSGTCATDTETFIINRGTPNFSLSVSPSSQTVKQDEAVNYSVSASCSGGFSGPITNLSVSGLPTGASGVFSNTSVSCGGSRTLTVSAQHNAPLISNDSFTVSGFGSGVGNRSATASLTIAQKEVGGICKFRVTSNIPTQGFMQGPGGNTATPPYFTSHEFNTWGDGSPMTQSGQYALYMQSDPALLNGYHSPNINPPNVNSGSALYTCNPSGGDDIKNITVTYQPPTQPPPPTSDPAVSCSASPSSATVGQGVTFTSTGGNGTYSWSAPGGTPSSGPGGTFSTSYDISGIKTVTVTSGSASNTCNVSVSEPTTDGAWCTPHTQTVNVGQTASLRAFPQNNGNWYAPGGNPERKSGSFFFDTAYGTPGLKTVNYTQAFKPTQTCSVNVVAPPTVDLKANNSNGPINIAHNGSATLSWTTTNNPTSCTATGSWSGSKAIGGGSQSTGSLVRPPSTRTYSISCTNSAGTSATDSVTVNVGAQPTGTVVVNSVTSTDAPIATTWTITGAASHQQTTPVTSRTYSSQPTGMYSFFPNDLAGYTKSVNSGTQTLNANNTITFTVTYTPTAPPEDDDDDDGGNPECSDGIDNDGDGDTDYPADAGCSSNDDTDESDDPPAPDDGGPDFSLSSSNNLSIDKDAGETTSNTTTIKVNPLAGFGANVTLSILSGPSVTYNFSDTTVTSSEYSSGETLSVTISSEFPRGNYPIVVQGQGGGLTRTRTVILSVDEQGPTFEEF